MERKPSGMCKINDCHRTGQTTGVMAGYCCALCTIGNAKRHSDACDMKLEAEHADIPERIVLGYN